ncbi:DUF3000 domain-containing protein [Cellulomonas chengniuliangii]|uniref:DUF3000 domain-containing protein n=1 Tax=Cellulomonas chengniuliangii TaxID=2968084 RepID=A0ABY5KZW1_9CELL|nr:DUF3000 domain-containing protein [Cellulomonas chengniuliangii]MCC2308549.1 DUF3000 domain-containing protein [Cellulomonas chengniuliangii]MCC2317566.1 DUF3000 domain-containing protein [Cellulomonas chengniuliangii]UUI73913.1 DUF3000 domain-containing protein [Cellulomonas chengniuliangii]
MIPPGPDGAPVEFVRALRSLRGVRMRPEIALEEVPGPSRIAPFSAALTAEVRSARRDPDAAELASGRFVVLHDPDGQVAWDGRFRLVTLVRASLEAEVGADPMLADVAWSWFNESFTGVGANPHAAGGTVTRVHSQSFGALEGRPDQVDLELRFSWTALEDDLAPHLRAWSVLLCTTAGLPPLPAGVVPLPRRR